MKKGIFCVLIILAVGILLAQIYPFQLVLARSYSQHGKHQEAIEVYKKAFQKHKLDKRDVSDLMENYVELVKPMLQRGSDAFRDGHFEEEKAIYLEITKIYEDYQHAFGHYQFDDDLTKNWRKVAKEGYARLADIHHQKKEWEAAFKDYREALLIYPPSPEILKVLLEFQYPQKLKNPADAQFIYDRAAEAKVTNPAPKLPTDN